jgi:tetratricopeptide (TPR) repeat protein
MVKKLRPDIAIAYNKGGNAKGKLLDYQEALVDYNKAISLMPDYATAYIIRGIAYLGLFHKSDALSDFLKAKDLGYNVPQELFDMYK